MTALVMAIPMDEWIDRGTRVLSLYACPVSFQVLGGVSSSASGGCCTDKSLAVGPHYFSNPASTRKQIGPRPALQDREQSGDPR